jgi:hypothetical protein
MAEAFPSNIIHNSTAHRTRQSNHSRLRRKQSAVGCSQLQVGLGCGPQDTWLQKVFVADWAS